MTDTDFAHEIYVNYVIFELASEYFRKRNCAAYGLSDLPKNLLFRTKNRFCCCDKRDFHYRARWIATFSIRVEWTVNERRVESFLLGALFGFKFYCSISRSDLIMTPVFFLFFTGITVTSHCQWCVCWCCAETKVGSNTQMHYFPCINDDGCHRQICHSMFRSLTTMLKHTHSHRHMQHNVEQNSRTSSQTKIELMQNWNCY